MRLYVNNNYRLACARMTYAVTFLFTSVRFRDGSNIKCARKREICMVRYVKKSQKVGMI